MTVPVNAQFQIADANLDSSSGIQAGGSSSKLAPSDAIHDAVAAMITASGGGSLPTQTGNSGKYLTTDGSTPSWGTVSGSLPSQTGNNGKVLKTDGTNASWSAESEIPNQTGNSGKYLTTDGTSVSWGTPSGGGGSGIVLQILQTTYTTNTALTVAIPYDDTVPTSSEGTQVLSQAITPADNTNKVLIQASLQGCQAGTANAIIAALFRGSTCIDVRYIVGSAAFPGNINFSIMDSPATSSAVTYSIRVGGDDTSAVRLNGTNAARKFGGTSTCTLILSEISA